MRRFAITDIETTGGQPAGNAITEIAVVVTDGFRELDRFHTLLQPDQSVPHYIEQLTGITDAMLADAPRFEDIAEKLFGMYEGAVFVAHNVGFDYAFVKAAFEAVGLRFNVQRLCTVRIARKVYPGLPGYSLSKLCSHFGIQNTQAHRALSDTLATVEVFRKCMVDDRSVFIETMLKRSATEQWLPPALPSETFDRLPEAPGVYYFEDMRGEYLYIGMSGNVKKRVRQHFGGKMQSARRQSFLKEIVNIEVTLTGSEAIAALIEDAEIRKYRPKFNKAQKTTVKSHVVTCYEDRSGYTRFTVVPARGHTNARIFSSQSAARECLLRLAGEHGVPFDLCGIQTGRELPPAGELKAAVQQLLTRFQPDPGVQVIPGKGRTRNERSFVALQGGQLLGYGYLEQHESLSTIAELEDRLCRIPSSELTGSILSHLSEKETSNIIEFE